MSSSADAKYFLSIPWCATHLTAPGVVLTIPDSRYRQSTTEHELFSTTLNTSQTIRFALVFFQPAPAADAAVREIKSFVTLAHGLDGYPGVCHGGIVATLLDEVMGFLFPINRGRGEILDTDYMTAYLNTNYLAPLPTPNTVLVVMRIVRTEDRKVWLEGHIEDESGKVFARAESLYVGLKPAKI